MISQRVPSFLPSTSALHFPNQFDPGPVLQVHVPLFGDIPIGTAAGGMCGGMVFTVTDFFRAGRPVPADTDAPKPGTPLFRYVADRLITSFNGVSGIMKYLQWMRYADEAIAWHTANEEWPAIQANLDAGQPCPLGVIKVESHNPLDLGHNHQVLAYGYDLDTDSGDLTVLVYDPNYPNTDDITLKLNLANPERPTRPVLSSDPAGRGFFRTDYRAADPTAALATA